MTQSHCDDKNYLYNPNPQLDKTKLFQYLPHVMMVPSNFFNHGGKFMKIHFNQMLKPKEEDSPKTL